MTTIVAAKVNGVVAICADTLCVSDTVKVATKHRVRANKLIPIYDTSPDTRTPFRRICVAGVTGSYAYAKAFQEVLTKLKPTDEDFGSTVTVAALMRIAHKMLKEDFFLVPDEEMNFEAVNNNILIATPYTIYGVYGSMEVEEYSNFWAIGSGREFALGAFEALQIMKRLNNRVISAEELVGVALAAAVEFDLYTDGFGDVHILERETNGQS